jgi:hypothetical protein
MWFGTALRPEPFLKATLIRIAGAIIIAVGCFAAALATSDRVTQRRSLKWQALKRRLVRLEDLT